MNWLSLVITVLIVPIHCRISYDHYHNYDELLSKLNSLHDDYPDLTRIYDLSPDSVQNRKLRVIQIGPNAVKKERPLLVPMVKYVGNMHGNEVIGRQLLVILAEYLLQEYHKGDKRIVKLLTETDLHFLITMNPDGFERSTKGVCRGFSHNSGRTNHKGIDLNRDFPDWDLQHKTNSTLYEDRAPETQAVMTWILSNPFVLSVNFHDGAVVANYPYDDSDGQEGTPSLTPDNKTFKKLARLYASRHHYMYKGSDLCENDNFPEGITNGAEWYIVKGGMQDFNYLFSNCFEITVELSCCKYPLEGSIQEEWLANKESMISYLEAGHVGVKGLVSDNNGNIVKEATVIVEGIDKPVKVSDRGEYWRLLAPGHYRLKATGNGYSSDWVQVRVGSWPDRRDNLDDQPERIDFTLDDLDPSSVVTRITPIASPVKPETEKEEENSESGAQGNNSLFSSVCYYLPALCGLSTWIGRKNETI